MNDISEVPKLRMFRGAWVREGFDVDRSMVKESLKNYSFFNYDENSVVLDLGSNIGGFAIMATSHKIKKYIGVEPDPENMDVVKKNVENALCEIDLILGAASISTDEELTFYQSASNNSKCSGTINSKGKIARTATSTSYKVKNYNVYELIEKYQPTHLKVDIEGAELPWLEDCKGIFNKCIKEIAFEIHNRSGVDLYCEYFDNIDKEFEHHNIQLNEGFLGRGNYEFPKLGLTSTAGTIWGADIFLKRKA